MNAAYIITDSAQTIERLLPLIHRECPDCTVAYNDSKITIESRWSDPRYEYLNLIEETREGILEEWEDSDNLVASLLKHPRFGQSKAFYATFSRSGMTSQLFPKIVSALENGGVKCVIFLHAGFQILGSEFLARVANDPTWRWDLSADAANGIECQ
jgi:hypothetical protein